jgi:tRNA nucleotidyltransferase (CCA-adding enzyme)
VDVPPAPELIARVRELPSAQLLLQRLADEPGVHLVGGAVRDVLLGHKPRELDLVVEGDAAALASRLGGTLRLHDRFGTSTVTIDGHTYDIARARWETYAQPGALPDVVPARLEEDLWRRDFTINAGAVALTGRRAGELRAIPGMLADLDARALRVLHDRSFIDDPTRMLRLARYAARLRPDGFQVEPHTRGLLDQALSADALNTVSRPRIGAELRLLAREPDPLTALGSLSALGLDRPLGLDGSEAAQTLGQRALSLLPDGGRRDRLVLAVAARGRVAARATPAARATMTDDLPGRLDAWGFTAADRGAITMAATQADALAQRLQAAKRPSDIAAAAGGAPDELVALAGALGPAGQAREWLQRLRHVRLEIDGGDLLAAGVPAGPAIGRALRAALASKLDGAASGREQELAAALRAAAEPGSG